MTVIVIAFLIVLVAGVVVDYIFSDDERVL